MMKKALFTILLVLAVAVTVAPARGAGSNYVFVTFTGYSSEVQGATTFELFIQYQASSTKVNIQGTLLALGGNPPVALTGSGDIEQDGTVESFNLTGNMQNVYFSNTYDFDFNIKTSQANVTLTDTHATAYGGTKTNTYVFYGTWVLQSCP
jgi:hypothetical protein